MTAHFNHTIIASTDPAAMADYYLDLLEAHTAPGWGPFTHLTIADEVLLQFARPPGEIAAQHYAYLVDDAHFDRAVTKIVQREESWWADPHRTRPSEVNVEGDRRSLYLLDPSGRLLELLTRPYL